MQKTNEMTNSFFSKEEREKRERNEVFGHGVTLHMLHEKHKICPFTIVCFSRVNNLFFNE
jgi:hypothetical protein